MPAEVVPDPMDMSLDKAEAALVAKALGIEAMKGSQLEENERETEK